MPLPPSDQGLAHIACLGTRMKVDCLTLLCWCLWGDAAEEKAVVLPLRESGLGGPLELGVTERGMLSEGSLWRLAGVCSPGRHPRGVKTGTPPLAERVEDAQWCVRLGNKAGSSPDTQCPRTNPGCFGVIALSA